MKNKITILLALILIAVSAFIISKNINQTNEFTEHSFTKNSDENVKEEKSDTEQTTVSGNPSNEKYSFYKNEKISFYYRNEYERCLSVFDEIINKETIPDNSMGCAAFGGSIYEIEDTSSFQKRLSQIMFMSLSAEESKDLGLEDTCYPYKTMKTSNGYNVFYFEHEDFTGIDSYDVNQYGNKCTYNPTTSEYGPSNIYLVVDDSGKKYIELSWRREDNLGAWEIINSLKFL